MSAEFDNNELRGRGRLFYQILSRNIHQAHNATGIKAEQIRKMSRLEEKVGSEGKRIILHLANNDIDSKDVPDNLHEIAVGVHNMLHPPEKPQTIRTKTKPLGFIPFGGTESVKTIYNTGDTQQAAIPADGGITIERTTFANRIINSLFKRK